MTTRGGVGIIVDSDLIKYRTVREQNPKIILTKVRISFYRVKKNALLSFIVPACARVVLGENLKFLFFM